MSRTNVKCTRSLIFVNPNIFIYITDVNNITIPLLVSFKILFERERERAGGEGQMEKQAPH